MGTLSEGLARAGVPIILLTGEPYCFPCSHGMRERAYG